MDFEFLTTEKGKQLLHSNGHLYWHILARENKSYWRCIYFQKGRDGATTSRCGGRANINAHVMRLTSDHNHSADPLNPELVRFQNRIKQQVVESRDAPRRLIANALQQVEPYARPHIRRSNITRDVCRIRHLANVEPANPQNLQDLEIPQAYRQIGALKTKVKPTRGSD